MSILTESVDLRLQVGGLCTHPEIVFCPGGSLRSMQFPNAFAVIQHPHHGPILYDTGYSQHFFEATQRLPFSLYRRLLPVHLHPHEAAAARLQRQGIAPEDVRHIIISHFHGDHIAALRDFPRASFICAEAAYAGIAGLRGWRALAHGFVPSLLPHDFARRVRLLRPADRVPSPFIGTGFDACYDLLGDGTLLATELPGHAGGQLGLWARRGDGQAFFLVADAVWQRDSFERFSHPRRLIRRFMHDPPAYMHTIERLHHFTLRHPEIAIVPSHCTRSLAPWLSQSAATAAPLESACA